MHSSVGFTTNTSESEFSVHTGDPLATAFGGQDRAAVRRPILPGQLAVTYFIPTFIVPLLLITHGLVFWILLQGNSVTAVHES
jgi:hypothetical protein